MSLHDLPTLAELQATRRAPAKGQPAVLERDATRKAKKLNHAQFRRAVWLRDQSRSRASGKPLARSGTDPHRVGEVHHVIPRSLAPERVFDVSNGLLLSRFEHALAETACSQDPAHCRLEIVGPLDRGQPQRFVFRDREGRIVKERVG
jgi:hypothetical protein